MSLDGNLMSTLQERISEYLREKPQYAGAEVAEADAYEYLLQRVENESRAGHKSAKKIEQPAAEQASPKEAG